MPVTKSTWHNRSISSGHGTWSTARNGYGHALGCGYQRPTNLLYVNTTLIATYNIYRTWLNFNTQDISSVTAARLGLYITTKEGITGSLVITKGLSREPIDENDWPTQTDEVTDLGSIAQSALVPNQYNWIELNAAGLAWINQSALELKQGESSDCERTSGYAVFAPWRFSQTRFPQSSVTITTLKLRLLRKGSPGTFYVDIYAADAQHKPTGPVLASGSIDGNALTTVTWGLWYEIDLGAGFTPTLGQEYCTVGYILAGNATNYVDWRGPPSGVYVNGHLWASGDNGATWTLEKEDDQATIDYEAVSVGGTNFCLRTAFDVSNLAPTSLQNQVVQFYSAQKGEGYLPLLDFYETYPTANLTRVTAIRHIYRPGLNRMEVTLGDVQNAIDMIDTKVRREVGAPGIVIDPSTGLPYYYPPKPLPEQPPRRPYPPAYYTPEVPGGFPPVYPTYTPPAPPQYAPEVPQPPISYPQYPSYYTPEVPQRPPITPLQPSALDIFKERMWKFMEDPLTAITETWGKIKWW